MRRKRSAVHAIRRGTPGVAGEVRAVAGPRRRPRLSMWALSGSSTLLDETDIHAVRAKKSLLTWVNSDGPHTMSLR